MPCWREIWDYVKSVLPLLGILASFVGYIVVVALLLWAPATKLRKKWMRITSRILGVLGIAPLAFVLPALLFGILLVSGDPPPKSRNIVSPDGQTATLIYHAGFLGRDSTEVKLKQPGCCWHTVVFDHSGPSEFDDPKVEWIDNQHLDVTYHTRRDDSSTCIQKLGAINITCHAELWPDSPAPPTQSTPHVPQ